MELLIHLGSVALLAIIVEVACRLGRFRPAICHALWLVVLIKLVVPPILAWPVGEFDFANVRPSQEATGEASDVAPRQAAGSLSLSETPPGDTPATASETVAPIAVSAITGDTIRTAALALWGIGALCVGLLAFRRARAARRIVQSGTPAPAWLQHRLDEVCRDLGVAEIKAKIVNTGCGSVYIHFLGRPTLVVSDTALAHIETDRWAPILTHEMAHLKRRDHWVAWVVLAAGVLWWWNPCLWWIRNRVHHFSELACDAWVVNTFPEERKNYAETMVQILALLSEQRSPALTLGLAVWSPAAQERRLWMIMKGNGACSMPWIYAAGVIALTVVVTPAWFAMAEKTTPGSESLVAAAVETPISDGWQLDLTPTQKAQDALTSRVNVEFTDLHLQEALEFMQDSFELNVAIDFRVVQPPPANRVNPFSIPPGRPQPAQAVTPPAAELPSPFPHDYVTDGMITTINAKNSSVGDVLNDILTPMGLTYVIQGPIVWISSAEQIEKDKSVPLPFALDKSSPVVDSLESKINIEFEDIHIDDILGFIQKAFEIDLLLDARVVTPETQYGEAAPAPLPSQVTDGMISYINVKDASLGSALFCITRMLNLSYRVDGDRVYISTPEGVKPGVAAYTPTE